MPHPPALFPIFLRMQGRNCVVIGAGRIAQGKVQSLCRAGAQVTVVAPQATARLQKMAREKKLRWIPRRFRAGDVVGATLVVAATNSPAVHEAVFQACRRARVLCNVVDDPERCDFFYPAVVRRDPLQIAISTAGASPMLASRLRRELEQQFGPQYARWLRQITATRRGIIESALPPKEKRARLHTLSSADALAEFVRKERKALGKARVQRAHPNVAGRGGLPCS